MDAVVDVDEVGVNIRALLHPMPVQVKSDDFDISMVAPIQLPVLGQSTLHCPDPQRISALLHPFDPWQVMSTSVACWGIILMSEHVAPPSGSLQINVMLTAEPPYIVAL